MISASEILRMIEAVDPSDLQKVHEIEYAIYVYRNPNTRASLFNVVHSPYHQYLRSRSALKTIRPKGWHILIETDDDGACCTMNKGCKRFSVVGLQTEELAEAHVFIQVLAFKKGNE